MKRTFLKARENSLREKSSVRSNSGKGNRNQASALQAWIDGSPRQTCQRRSIESAVPQADRNAPTSPIPRGIIQLKAYIKARPLDSVLVGWAADHHHIIFDGHHEEISKLSGGFDNNIGFHKGGLFGEKTDDFKYGAPIKEMPDEDKAVRAVAENKDPGKYSLFLPKNHCQVWAAKVGTSYDKL